MTLFDPGPPVPDEEQLSYGRRLTIRNKESLERGIHPITYRPVADNGETCGTCAHHVTHRRSQTWHKCELNATRGPATDLRVSWPACTAWEADR